MVIVKLSTVTDAYIFIVIIDNEVDGIAVLHLTEGDLYAMLPGKVGIVRKLLVLLQREKAHAQSPANTPTSLPSTSYSTQDMPCIPQQPISPTFTSDLPCNSHLSSRTSSQVMQRSTFPPLPKLELQGSLAGSADYASNSLWNTVSLQNKREVSDHCILYCSICFYGYIDILLQMSI